MRRRRTVLFLIVVMATVVIAACGVVLTVLYETAFRAAQDHLAWTARSQARLMEAVAGFRGSGPEPERAAGSSAATLQLVRQAHRRLQGFGETGEFTVARRDGETIRFLLRHRLGEQTEPKPVPFASALAEPMRRALSGRSGTVVGLDYRGELVLAAHEPVDGMDLGIVAKIDLAEIRQPFVRAGLEAVLAAGALILLGTVAFLRMGNPLVRSLAEKERMYRSLFEHSLDGVALHEIVTDGDGKPTDYVFIEVNAAFERLTGLKAVDIEGRRVTEVIPGIEKGPFIEKYGRVALTGEPVRFEQYAEPLDRHYDIAAFSPKQRQFAVVFSDVTERKRAEKALRESQKLESLGILAGGVAHDFNNLLVGMLGHSSLALSRLPAESPGRASIEKVIQAAERASDLSRQMLAYSGRGHFQVRPTDLNTLVRENLHLLEAAVPKAARLRAQLPEQAAVVEGDAGQLQQLVMNLVINAAEASGEHPGTVTITTETKRLSTDGARYARFTGRELPPGQYVLLEVRDDGCGMDEETVSRVFDPFFTTKFTGRGLGLAAVLGVVRGHNGGIEIESAPGRGTSFKILLPATEESPRVPVATAARSVPGEATILVIDDEEIVRDALREMLAPLGLEVLTAPDGAAGVALFEERAQDIRLVLLDLSMPGVTGEQTFHDLRGHDPDVPIVLSSGFTEEEAVSRFEGLGLSGFLQKPYRLETLIATIRRSLR